MTSHISSLPPQGGFVLRASRAAVCVFLASLACDAARAAGDLDEVVVTPARMEQRLGDVLADVSVIDAATLAASGATSVGDVLAQLPGVEMVRNGGAAATTSVYVRGGETRHTAVFIDGVRVDSQSTGGAPWGAIALSQIERIEVVRGPAATVYGSDAVAGVVQIFTRQAQQGPAQLSASVGVGNRGTRDAAAHVRGGAQGWDYALGAGFERSDGFNARSDPNAYGYNPDRDGHRRSSGQARLGYQIDARHRVHGAWLGSYTNGGYDASADADDRSRRRLNTLNLAWDGQWSDAYKTTLSVNESRESYATSPNPYRTETRVRSYLLHNEWQLSRSASQSQRLTAALERREDRLDNDPIARSRHQNALALGWALDAGAHALQLHLRHDDDSEFGAQTTGSLAYGLALSPQWRVRAALAQSFRAPTLYQRFSEYGVADLEPEKGRNVELGLTYISGAQRLSLTAYRNQVRDLIAFGAAGACDSSFGCYANTARARYEGLTLAGQTRLGHWRLDAALDWQKPQNLDTGKLLARRARRHATLGAQYAMDGWLLGAQWQGASQRWDNAANTQKLGGYGLLNLSVSKALSRDWTLLARLDNATDKRYELARGYATPGRTLYVGLSWGG